MQLNTEFPREWMMWLRENQQIGLVQVKARMTSTASGF